MIRVDVRAADGSTQRIEGRAGQSLMRAVTDAGIDGIAADCGGVLSCATCHVFVEPAWAARLPPPSADERAMLEMTAVPADATSRLSCQIVLEPALNGLAVRLPASQY